MRAKKLDQDGVAALLNAPQSAVGAYIRGERGFRLGRFMELAELTGIDLKILVAWTVDQKSRGSGSKRRSRARRQQSS